jgi:hypothetical protein
VSGVEVQNVYVYNALGKEVINSVSPVLNVGELNNGMYYVRVLFSNGQYITKPLFKQP